MMKAKTWKVLTICGLVVLEGWSVGSVLEPFVPSVAIIGGADGPTTIFLAGKLGDEGQQQEGLEPVAGQVPPEEEPMAPEEEPGQEPEQEQPEAAEPAGPEVSQAGDAALAQARQEAAAPMSKEEADAQGILLLVNKQYPLASDYKPGDLASIKYYATDRSESGRYMRAEAADAFHQLVETAQAEQGYTIVMTTAYRSYGFQKTLWDNYVAKDGEAEASKYSARPGTSEHQTGLAVDVSSPTVSYELTREFGDTDEGAWLRENAHRFGFIIRFPQGKEDITGYNYEPWHLRYVGLEAAAQIHELDITLEEYLLLQ